MAAMPLLKKRWMRDLKHYMLRMTKTEVLHRRKTYNISNKKTEPNLGEAQSSICL